MTSTEKERLRRQIGAELLARGIDWKAELDKRPTPPGLIEFIEKTTAVTLYRWQRIFSTQLERFHTEKGLRWLVHGPPQWGKSLVKSKRFPAWGLGMNPLRRIVQAGYNIEHTRTQFTEQVRNVMLTPEFKEFFPACEISKIASAGAFSTTARQRLNDGQDSIVALGLQTGFTGKGIAEDDWLLIDDPYASPEEAYSSLINEKTWRFWDDNAKNRVHPLANVAVTFHRYHDDDFAGRLMATGEWEYIRFPAIADGGADDPTNREVGELLSDMWPMEKVLSIKENNPKVFYSQWQGVPRPDSGGFIKREYIRVGEVPHLNLLIRYWDLAVSEKQTADWTAGALGGVGPGQMFYLKDMERFRMEWPDACERIIEVTERDALWCRERGVRYAVGIDARISQKAFFAQLMRHHLFDPTKAGPLKVQLWPDNSKGDKRERASGWVAEGKFARFMIGKAPWNEPFINECLAFTGEDVDTDDQVDAVSGLHSLTWQLLGGIQHDKTQAEPGSNAALDKLIRIQERSTGRGLFRD